MLGDTAVPPTSVSAPLLPGVPSPAAVQGDEVMHTLTAPVMAGAAVMSPLIRPLNATAPVALTSWSTAPEVMAPGLLRAPAPDTTSSPSPTPSPPPTRSADRPLRHGPRTWLNPGSTGWRGQLWGDHERGDAGNRGPRNEVVGAGARGDLRHRDDCRYGGGR
jgi:hypothetical protein